MRTGVEQEANITLNSYDSFYFLHRNSLVASIQEGTAPREILWCILAFSARFCKSLRDLFPESPNAASEHYAAIASQALFNSTASPGTNLGLSAADTDVTLVRCQCFLILGLYECTAGIENQGWLKLGIANRFAHLLRTFNYYLYFLPCERSILLSF